MLNGIQKLSKKLVDWISVKIKGKNNENRIYLISNFEINKEDHELYLKNAQKKSEEEHLNIDIIHGIKHRNEIRTAKYKIYTFLPLIVFFQFLRLGNLYFLSISALQLIPEITDSKGMPTYLIPLVFIIVVSMIKEFFEDWQRHKSDNEENSKKTMVFENGILKEKKWADIKDGDVVKIFAYEYFPADLIVLNCSNKKGIVNIETKNVDGESNVKHKYCLPDISKYFNHDKYAGYCRVELISERPNDDIFDYSGYIILPPLQFKKKNGDLVRFYDKQNSINRESQNSDMATPKERPNTNVTMEKGEINIDGKIQNENALKCSNGKKYETPHMKTKKENSQNGEKIDEGEKESKNIININIDNLVLRGTSLVNTKWIYGLVINTGNRTKLMRNASTKSREKWSRLEFVYGNHVIVLIMCQIFISFIVAIGGVLWMRKQGYNLWYLNLYYNSDSLKTFFITIGSMILLFGSFIPVDLLLIWEVVRLLQGYLINWDNDMYSKKTGRYALSKAGQLLEEMGNVTHIYSDKTGTLTQNVMQLQNIGLGNKGVYGFYDFSDIKESIIDKQKKEIVKKNKKKDEGRKVNMRNNAEHINPIAFHSESNSNTSDSENDDINDSHETGNADAVNNDCEDDNNNYLDKQSKYIKELEKKKDDENWAISESKMNGDPQHNKSVSYVMDPLNWSRTSINPHKNKRKHIRLNSLSHNETITNIYSEKDFVRGDNEFVFFNRILFVNKIYSIRKEAEDQIYFLLLVLSLCHSAMIRNVDIDDMDIESSDDDTSIDNDDKDIEGSDKNRKKKNNSNEKMKIYDKETKINYTYLTPAQPQYDASSPDELALISTSLYLGCEFINRPNLRTIEIELTSSFAQRFVLGEKCFNNFMKKKSYYEDNFDTYFPNAYINKEGKKEPKFGENVMKKNNNNNNTNTNDVSSSFHMSIPIRNMFISNKVNTKDPVKTEQEEKEKILNKKVVPILSFEILDVFPFDNVRKRMSLIVKNEKDEIFMLLKGADTSVLKLASKSQKNIVDHVEYQLNAFATSGLRTLVLGYKHLTKEEFKIMYNTHIENRKKSELLKDDTYLQNFYDEYENNLLIIGCTGIDDKLQDDVPQVIQDLRDAGLTICVLTGDKLETAINIGHSINILNKHTYNAVFTETDSNILLEQINTHEKNTNAANLLNADHSTKWWNSVNWEHLNLDLRSETILNFMKTNFFNSVKKNPIPDTNMVDLKNDNHLYSSVLAKQEKVYSSFLESRESLGNVKSSSESIGMFNKMRKNDEHDFDSDNPYKPKDKIHYSQFSITITGESLDVIMKNKILKIKFYTLARSASTLIACRVTPKQKSLFVKENSAFNPRGTSLAIGDGANDVGMILMANVGVGIAGKEGLQAARSSDFTISEFKYLKKLLFVHGRESLRRNSFLVYFCIFRNVSFCLCSMVLIFWTGYSATDAWNPWTKQIINIAFTSLPVIFFVALDKQLPHNILLNNPLLYETSPSTLWPLYANKKIYYYTRKIKNSCKKLTNFFLLPFKFIPYFQKYVEKIKSWIWKRSKPEKFRSYGTHFLFIYLLFAIWLAAVETIIILHFSTGQDHSMFHNDRSVDIDFNTFSQMLYTHHVVAVNAVVALMINTWFVISHVVLWFEIIITLLFWFVISNIKVFLDIVGADELHGTFEKAHSSSNYYMTTIISLYTSMLPLLILMTYQFMKKPTMEQIVLEQINMGKFEGLRKCQIKKLAYIDSQNSSNYLAHKGFAFAVEAKGAFWGLVQKAIYKIKIPLSMDENSFLMMKKKT
ncbi:ATPase [Plasmodium vinckei petteri]|uniref:ATPase n=1 Tax=Plasmodium vinckei petteri TaxID=138298 RepID=W7B7H8_PLAVN|nr:ATPase [Plasmodium vinckei petteri]